MLIMHFLYRPILGSLYVQIRQWPHHLETNSKLTFHSRGNTVDIVSRTYVARLSIEKNRAAAQLANPTAGPGGESLL